jgi:hypothetical protein
VLAPIRQRCSTREITHRLALPKGAGYAFAERTGRRGLFAYPNHGSMNYLAVLVGLGCFRFSRWTGSR